MINDIDYNQKRRRNRTIAGGILIASGTAYLLNQFNFLPVPYWVFSWPMLLIVLGLFSGTRHNFRSPGWFFMVLIGSLFLLNTIIPTIHIVFFWPVILIAVGFRLMFLRKGHWYRDHWERRKQRWNHYDRPDYTSL